MSSVVSLSDRADAIIRNNTLLISLKPVIEKELVHYDIFYHLRESALMPEDMVFIGGTCLRLCHGSNRYSEDLDFHAGASFQPQSFDKIRESLERYLSDRYGLTVEVKQPKELRDDPEYGSTKANTWKVIINTHPSQRHLPAQRIHIDIANIPTHRAEQDVIRVNYNGLPAGYDTLLVKRSSKEEILADKFIALAARNNIKARDIWDIQWLIQKNTSININLIQQKIVDHGLINFDSLMDRRIDSLGDYWSTGLFEREMSRFLDSNLLNSSAQNTDFLDYLKREISKHAEYVRDSVDGKIEIIGRFEM